MKKRFAVDMLLNIVATAIPTFVLQLLLLPLLSRHMTDDDYGLLVTILSLINVIPATMGNTLNNIRLIIGGDQKPGEEKNYNYLLFVMIIVNLIIVSVFLLSYDKNHKILSIVLTLLLSALYLLREYHIVAFRIDINYKNIMISNLILVVGYGIGYLVFRASGDWQFLYIFGLLISLIYIFKHSRLWKEPYSRDRSFKHICGQTLLLMISSFLARVTTYADKLFIFPILGGTAVSIYYAATLFGKVVSMIITPVSSVMLSYLSKIKKKNDNLFNTALISSLIVCVVGYFFGIVVSRPILGLLYPQFVYEAMQYIWLTTGSMVLSALITIINPFVLKFFDMKWQIVISGTYVLIYIVLTMSLLYSMGLLGFCFGTLLANGIKLCFMLLIYYRFSGKQTKLSIY